jgi:hypothetical protein
VQRLETLIKNSGLLAQGFKCLIDLKRWYAHAFIFTSAELLRELNDTNARDIGIQIAVLLLRNEPVIYEANVSFLRNMTSRARRISINREDFKRFGQKNLVDFADAVVLRKGAVSLIE